MLSSLLIESTRTFDLHEKASEQEVFDRVRQLQKENTQQQCVPEFYFGPTKVEAGSIAFYMRRVVQRKQTEQLLLGITKLIEELQDNSSEQDRVSHLEFQKVSWNPSSDGDSIFVWHTDCARGGGGAGPEGEQS